MNDNFTSSAAFLLQKMRQSIALGGEIGVWVENFGLALEALRETTHSRQINMYTHCQL